MAHSDTRGKTPVESAVCLGLKMIELSVKLGVAGSGLSFFFYKECCFRVRVRLGLQCRVRVRIFRCIDEKSRTTTCEVGSILGERFFRRELLSEMSISYFIFDSFFYFICLSKP